MSTRSKHPVKKNTARTPHNRKPIRYPHGGFYEAALFPLGQWQLKSPSCENFGIGVKKIFDDRNFGEDPNPTPDVEGER